MVSNLKALFGGNISDLLLSSLGDSKNSPYKNQSRDYAYYILSDMSLLYFKAIQEITSVLNSVAGFQYGLFCALVLVFHESAAYCHVME